VSFRKAVDRIRPALVAVRPLEGAGPLYRPGRPPVFGPFRPGELSPRNTLALRGAPREPGGSGLVIDADKGYVLTTDSHLRGASQAVVIFSDGREKATSQIRRDVASDLALLAIDPKGLNLAQVQWGEVGSLQVGDWVLSVGLAPGSAPTVSAGIYSSRRAVPALGLPEAFLETDAAINPLNSGGPLINLSGEVVGIAAALPSRFAPEGMGLAIPADLARHFAAELAQSGRVRRGYLGMEIIPREQVSTELPSTVGAVVVSAVTAGSPAAEAGLRPGDVIRSAGRRPVAGVEMLRSLVAHAPIGQELELEIEREGKRLQLKARPLEQPASPSFPGGAVPPPQGENRRDALRGRLRSRELPDARAAPRVPRPASEPERESLEPIPKTKDGSGA
jgi:serine protease Do